VAREGGVGLLERPRLAPRAIGAQVFRDRTFIMRLHQFAIASDAFIVVPGGIGTLFSRPG
jgi:predicted Rossmann-fold nucleotide-binding protein